jgi:hypothetical protein
MISLKEHPISYIIDLPWSSNASLGLTRRYLGDKKLLIMDYYSWNDVEYKSLKYTIFLFKIRKKEGLFKLVLRISSVNKNAILWHTLEFTSFYQAFKKCKTINQN